MSKETPRSLDPLKGPQYIARQAVERTLQPTQTLRVVFKGTDDRQGLGGFAHSIQVLDAVRAAGFPGVSMDNIQEGQPNITQQFKGLVPGKFPDVVIECNIPAGVTPDMKKLQAGLQKGEFPAKNFKFVPAKAAKTPRQ
ncbi:MAG: hypothetical protein V1936_04325 [Patescibacteria group bacterium]